MSINYFNTLFLGFRYNFAPHRRKKKRIEYKLVLGKLRFPHFGDW